MVVIFFLLGSVAWLRCSVGLSLIRVEVLPRVLSAQEGRGDSVILCNLKLWKEEVENMKGMWYGTVELGRINGLEILT